MALSKLVVVEIGNTRKDVKFGHRLSPVNSFSFPYFPIHIPIPIIEVLYAPNNLVPLGTVNHKNLIFSSEVVRQWPSMDADTQHFHHIGDNSISKIISFKIDRFSKK